MSKKRCGAVVPLESAEAILAKLEQARARLAAVLEIHKPFGVYDECGHDHQPGDPDTFQIDDVGIVCAAGLLYKICEACHTVNGLPTEDADEGCFPCPTRKAAEGK